MPPKAGASKSGASAIVLNIDASELDEGSYWVTAHLQNCRHAQFGDVDRRLNFWDRDGMADMLAAQARAQQHIETMHRRYGKTLEFRACSCTR